MTIITEYVTMQTLPEITDKEFKEIVDGLEKNFHSKQPGFIDTELCCNDKSGEWVMIQHWNSREQLQAASRNMFKDEQAAPFVRALDPKSVKMIILEQIKTW